MRAPPDAGQDKSSLGGSPGPLPFDPALQPAVTQAEQDLAQRLRLPVDGIRVIAVVVQEFSTEAFYCRTTKERIAKEVPSEVMSGESILLSASGRRYEYHASGQTVVFCRPLP